MTTESILGPMEKRQKTDLRLPVVVADKMKALADAIGIPANAVYAVAAAMLVVKLSKLMEPQLAKREALLRRMEELFQNILSEVRRSS